MGPHSEMMHISRHIQIVQPPHQGLHGLLIRIAAHHGLSLEILRGRGRIKHVVEARREFAIMARTHGYSLVAIGIELGGRDHTTIMNLVQPRKLRRVA